MPVICIFIEFIKTSRKLGALGICFYNFYRKMFCIKSGLKFNFGAEAKLLRLITEVRWEFAFQIYFL